MLQLDTVIRILELISYHYDFPHNQDILPTIQWGPKSPSRTVPTSTLPPVMYEHIRTSVGVIHDTEAYNNPVRDLDAYPGNHTLRPYGY